MEHRTRSDSKYRPIRKEVSRYGKLERALRELQAQSNGKKDFTFSPNDAAKRTRCLDAKAVGQIFEFTTGIKLVDKRTYKFDGNPIEVMINERNPF